MYKLLLPTGEKLSKETTERDNICAKVGGAFSFHLRAKLSASHY